MVDVTVTSAHFKWKSRQFRELYVPAPIDWELGVLQSLSRFAVYPLPRKLRQNSQKPFIKRKKP